MVVLSVLFIVSSIVISSSRPGFGLLTNLMNFMEIGKIQVNSNFLPPLTKCTYQITGNIGCHITFATKYFVAAGLIFLSYGILLVLNTAPTLSEIRKRLDF